MGFGVAVLAFEVSAVAGEVEQVGEVVVGEVAFEFEVAAFEGKRFVGFVGGGDEKRFCCRVHVRHFMHTAFKISMGVDLGRPLGAVLRFQT